jgi:transcription elongation factor Elf1
MHLHQEITSTGFKFVCTDCGNLSIKMTERKAAAADTIIECGRCSAVRGTLADLHVLARRSRDIFEF